MTSDVDHTAAGPSAGPRRHPLPLPLPALTGSGRPTASTGLRHPAPIGVGGREEVMGLGKRPNERDGVGSEQPDELIWEVPVRDLLGRQRAAEIAVNEHGEVVLLPPHTGGLLVDPELEFEWLISTLRAARSIARRERRRPR